MAHGSEEGGDGLAPHAVAGVGDEARVATRSGGADHATSGPLPHAAAAAAMAGAGKAAVRERDSNGHHAAADEGKALKIGIYGMVNAMMAIPILYGYAAIIFRWVVDCNTREFRLQQ